MAATVFVYVRASINIRDVDGNPVADARVVAAPTIEVMRTEEWVDRLRRSIELRKSEGRWKPRFAMGTTDLNGVVDLEYLAMTDLGDPMFDDRERASEEFAFPTCLRIDSKAYGTVFQPLRTATKVRYRRDPAPGDPWGFAEATFVIRGDVSAPCGNASDAARAVEVERKGGGSERQK